MGSPDCIFILTTITADRPNISSAPKKGFMETALRNSPTENVLNSNFLGFRVANFALFLAIPKKLANIQEMNQEQLRAVLVKSFFRHHRKIDIEKLLPFYSKQICSASPGTYFALKPNTYVIGRKVLRMPAGNIEAVRLNYYTRILNANFKIRYPNRDEIFTLLFGEIDRLRFLPRYTVVRFDFQNFFNTVSPSYVFDLCIKNSMLFPPDREEIRKACSSMKRCYPGIAFSSALIELIGKEFDRNLQLVFREHDIRFYQRYVDDGLLFLGHNVPQRTVIKLLKDAVFRTFYALDKGKKNRNNVALHLPKSGMASPKFTCVSPATNTTLSFGFLGCDFHMAYDSNVLSGAEITYGISEHKRNRIVSSLARRLSDPRCNFRLRQEILKNAVRRVVYFSEIHQGWQSTGLASRYIELAYRFEKMDGPTLAFLTSLLAEGIRLSNLGVAEKGRLLNMVNSFSRNEKSIYNAWSSFRLRRANILSPGIGYDRKHLIHLLQKIDTPWRSYKGWNYNKLVARYRYLTKMSD